MVTLYRRSPFSPSIPTTNPTTAHCCHSPHLPRGLGLTAAASTDAANAGNGAWHPHTKRTSPPPTRRRDPAGPPPTMVRGLSYRLKATVSSSSNNSSNNGLSTSPPKHTKPRLKNGDNMGHPRE